MYKLLCFALFFISFSWAQATVYYVDPTHGGLNTNTGYVGSPWATIQHAASTAVAGDTVYVQPGIYSEQVIFAQSGAPNAFITFEAIGPVIVQGTAAVTVWTGIFNIYNKEYIRIKNFSLENSYWFGIYVESSKNIYIENDSTYNTGASGISVWHSNNVYASNNVVRKACYQSLTTGSQECITFSGVVDFEIHHNEVYESGGSTNGGEGIDAKDSCMNGKVYNNLVHDLIRLGIYADCWDKTLQNLERYNNRIYKCSEGIVLASENGGTLKNVKVYNNLAYGNSNFGITISDYAANGPRQNIYIMNNTVYNNGYGDSNTSWGGGIIILTSNISNTSIFNNIVSNNDAMQLSDKSGVASVSIDKNLINDYRGHSWTYEVKGTNVLEADPLFLDADGSDNIADNLDDNLDVNSSSPAINQGTNTNAPLFDFNYFVRPAEVYTDMGAFEHNSIPLSILYKNSTESSSLQIYPNPSSENIYIQLPDNFERMEIWNGKGNLVYKYESVQKEVLEIDLPGSGIYMIKVFIGNKSEVYKAIKY